jgi:hypothetical protein
MSAQPWFGHRTAPPEIGLAPEQIVDTLTGAFRGIPRSNFPLALQPMVVPQQSFRELLSATAELLSLLRRTVAGLADDRAGRITALGIDPADCPLFTPDEDFELRHSADMTRADVIIGPDGPKFVEFNVSGAFGGMVHFMLYQKAWASIREQAGRPAYVAADPYSRYAQLIETTSAELGQPPSAVIVGTPRDWGPDVGTRMFDVQVDALRGHGVPATHLDFDDLLAGIGLPDKIRWPLGIAAFTPQDAAEIGYSLEPARVAQEAGLVLIPSQSAWFLHSKKTLALLSEGQPWMTRRETELVQRYVPWSRVVGDRKVRWHDERHDLPRLLVEHQESFVLKGATGWSCQEVYFGWTTSPQRWAELVDEAVRTGYYIAQERVPAETYPLDLVTEAGEVKRISAESVVSPFCLGGRPAGCHVRFAEAGDQALAIGGPGAGRTCLLAEA